jgi:hypothetical protein
MLSPGLQVTRGLVSCQALTNGSNARARCETMIRAIVFDLFETLVTQTGFDVPRASLLGKSLGLDDAAYRSHWKRRRPLVLVGELALTPAIPHLRVLGDVRRLVAERTTAVDTKTTTAGMRVVARP